MSLKKDCWVLTTHFLSSSSYPFLISKFYTSLYCRRNHNLYRSFPPPFSKEGHAMGATSHDPRTSNIISFIIVSIKVQSPKMYKGTYAHVPCSNYICLGLYLVDLQWWVKILFLHPTERCYLIITSHVRCS